MASSRRVAFALLAASIVSGSAVAAVAPLGIPADMAAPASKPGGQGYLGINMRDIGDDEVASLRLRDSRGAMVMLVDHDGPAGKAGIRERDVILSLNGVIIEGEEDLRRMLRETAPGRNVSMVVSRDGVVQTVAARMANREELEKQAWNQHWSVPAPKDEQMEPEAQTAPQRGGNAITRSFLGSHLLPTPVYTGATIDALGPQLAEFFGAKDGRGILVCNVDGNSPASAAGLRAGDVITRANSTPIGTTNDWNRWVRDNKGRAFSITIVRDHKEQTMTLVPDAKHRGQLGGFTGQPMAVVIRLVTFNFDR